MANNDSENEASSSARSKRLSKNRDAHAHSTASPSKKLALGTSANTDAAGSSQAEGGNPSSSNRLGSSSVFSNGNLEQHLTCSICQEIMHDPCNLVPCNHTYCGGCISSWMASSKECPQCRQHFVYCGYHHMIASLAACYLDNHPERKRSPEELAILDSKNTIPRNATAVNHPVSDNDDWFGQHPVYSDNEGSASPYSPSQSNPSSEVQSEFSGEDSGEFDPQNSQSDEDNSEDEEGDGDDDDNSNDDDDDDKAASPVASEEHSEDDLEIDECESDEDEQNADDSASDSDDESSANYDADPSTDVSDEEPYYTEESGSSEQSAVDDVEHEEEVVSNGCEKASEPSLAEGQQQNSWYTESISYNDDDEDDDVSLESPGDYEGDDDDTA